MMLGRRLLRRGHKLDGDLDKRALKKPYNARVLINSEQNHSLTWKSSYCSTEADYFSYQNT